jgi:hypothetical protein
MGEIAWSKTTRAEIKRGCVISLDLDSTSSILRQGGSVASGSMSGVRGSRRGCRFASANLDGLVYNLIERRLDVFSFVVDFMPMGNSPSDNLGCAFFDYGTPNDDYIAVKASGDTNRLRFDAGNTTLVQINPSNWQDHWRQNRRNILAGACASGNNKIWLNGYEIGSSSNAWTGKNVSTMYVGRLDVAAWYVDGIIYGIKIFDQLLTQREVIAYFESIRDI